MHVEVKTIYRVAADRRFVAEISIKYTEPFHSNIVRCAVGLCAEQFGSFLDMTGADEEHGIDIVGPDRNMEYENLKIYADPIKCDGEFLILKKSVDVLMEALKVSLDEAYRWFSTKPNDCFTKIPYGDGDK